MNKKIFLLLIVISLLFTSCWIYPDYKDYEIIDKVYYFDDYETMKSVIIPNINKSFSAWHWSEEEFDKKYEKYMGNINPNEDDYKILVEKKYEYAVRNRSKDYIAQPKQGAEIRAEYFWITTKDNEGVVFYQN